MIKVYESGCDIAISIVTKKGKNKFVSFDAKTNGSVLWTGDEDIQWGIEHHSWYEKTIVLKCVYEEECQNGGKSQPNGTDVSNGNDATRRTAQNQPNGTDDSNGNDATRRTAQNQPTETDDSNGNDATRRTAQNQPTETDDTFEEEETEDGLIKVSVSGADDAVEYLMENYGMKAKQLKSLKSIRKAAQERGIVFDGLD